VLRVVWKVLIKILTFTVSMSDSVPRHAKGRDRETETEGEGEGERREERGERREERGERREGEKGRERMSASQSSRPQIHDEHTARKATVAQQVSSDHGSAGRRWLAVDRPHASTGSVAGPRHTYVSARKHLSASRHCWQWAVMVRVCVRDSRLGPWRNAQCRYVVWFALEVIDPEALLPEHVALQSLQRAHARSRWMVSPLLLGPSLHVTRGQLLCNEGTLFDEHIGV
jgi:hypothetical protein